MREIFFDENSVSNGLEQANKILIREGFDSYTILAINHGGKEVAERLAKLSDCFDSFLICNLKNGDVDIPDLSQIKQKKILICDDTTITGRTFIKVFNKLKESGIDDIKLFSILMRRNSSIVPNVFIIEVEEDTKVYFPWSDYPIRTYPKGIVRKIAAEDCKSTFICGDERIDKYSLSDYYKNQEYGNCKVYLVEDSGIICSIVQFHEHTVEGYTGLFLDIIATSEGSKGNDYARTLLKLLSLYMIYHEFKFIYAHAFDDIIDMYKKIGFEVIGSVDDPNYGTLHKIVIVNGNEVFKDKMVAVMKCN